MGENGSTGQARRVSHAAGLYMDRLRVMDGPSDAELIKAIEELISEEMSKQIGAALGAFS